MKIAHSVWRSLVIKRANRSTSDENIYHKGESNLYTTQKMKFSIQDFFIKSDQIRGKLRTWSHLLKKSLMENFIFCAVLEPQGWFHELSLFHKIRIEKGLVLFIDSYKKIK